MRKKAKFLYKGLAFPSPPSRPHKVSVFLPHFVSSPGKLCYYSRQQVGFFFLLFIQMLPTWTEGRCSFTSTDFQKKTLIPWSTRVLLKSRFWAQKELYIYILFGFLQKGDIWGQNVCSPRPAATIVFSAWSTKPKEPFKYSGSWKQIPFPKYGRQLLLASGLPPGKHKTNREPKSKTSPEWDGFSPELEAGENVNSE